MSAILEALVIPFKESRKLIELGGAVFTVIEINKSLIPNFSTGRVKKVMS